jgi:competence protein CoiA
MLQAKTNQGELITLVSLSVGEIDNYKKRHEFYCPACEEHLIIKAGKRIIPHFAHYPKSNCEQRKGGEGPYHEKGKLLLYQWFRSQHLHVELEPYLKEIKQLPDLLLTLNHKRIAIEFQCARISIDQLQQRNKGFQKAGIIPIWILGANQFNRVGKYHLKLDQFIKQFIHQFSPSSSQKLLYFCPETLQLTVFQDIYFTKSGQAVGRFYFNKLYKMKFTDLFMEYPLLRTDLYQLWKNEKRNFRLGSGKRLYGRDLAWHQWLYSQQTHREYLPSLIHLPVSTQYLMKSPPWDWQSRLCISIIEPLPVGRLFTFNRSKNILRNHFYKQSYFPLIETTEHPIQQYFHLLVQLKVIQKQSSDQFIKIKSIPFHTHVEGALISDDLIMDELILNGGNKIRA